MHERELALDENENFSSFSINFHKPCGYAVILVEFFMINIWISTLNRAVLTVMPYPYVFLYDSDTVPERYITGFPKDVAQYAVLARTHRSHPYTSSQVSILNFLKLTALLRDLMWLSPM